jgi:anthranilate phosphoribosyltransferase
MKVVNPNGSVVSDIVGTGGSRQKTFNVSTAAAFVAAGAGVKVAKHGNRAATSRTGSADVLTELGVRVDVPNVVTESCLETIGICFMFAPAYHSLSPALARARRTFGRPTIFNNLGPLCNPSGAQHQVIGVWSDAWLERTANVLSKLGTKRSWVVNNEQGLDEIGLAGKTRVAEVSGPKVTFFTIDAHSFGLEAETAPIPTAQTAAESAAIIKDVLAGRASGKPAEQIVLMNAAAAILISGTGDDLKAAYNLAEESIRSGAAEQKLFKLAEATNR